MQPGLQKGADVIPVTEIAVRLGLGLSQTYQALERGDIPGRRVGRRWVVARSVFQRWLDGEASEPPAAA